MEKTNINNLSEGQTVDDYFLLNERSLKTTSRGSFYLRMVLSDKTGKINAIMWDANQNILGKLPQECFVRVRGVIESYDGKLQMIIRSITRENEENIDISHFVASSHLDTSILEKRLWEHIESVKETGLNKLLKSFFENKEFADAFVKAPAAVVYHNAYLGGLLEHTVCVCDIAQFLCDKYEFLNRDMLITGSILHDMGKVFEISYSLSLNYTTPGRLLGHLIQASFAINENAKDIDEISQERTDELIHLVLSHHGEYEWGSPKLPMTREAIALHHIDNLDAKVSAFNQIIEAESDNENDWTNYSKLFNRYLYKGSQEK